MQSYKEVYKMVKKADEQSDEVYRVPRNLRDILTLSPTLQNFVQKNILPRLQRLSSPMHPEYSTVLGYGNFDLPARLRMSSTAARAANYIRDPKSIPTVETKFNLSDLTSMDKYRLMAPLKRILNK